MAQSLSLLFFEVTGKKAGEQTALTASGSNRRYYRIESEDKTVSLIGVQGTSRDENHAFLYMAEHFMKKGLNVPKVLAVSDDEMNYVQQDLGNVLLFDYIAEGRKTGVFSAKEKEMLRETMRALARFQVTGAEEFDFNQCYPQPEFNLRSILWDLNYFKYCFLKATGLEFQEDKLENEFERLAYILLQNRMNAFMYRDFQSRNVMVVEKVVESSEGSEVQEVVPYFIDFQGVEYDLTAWDIVNGGHYYLAKPYGIENKEVVFALTQVVDAQTPYIIQFKEPYFHDKMITFHGKESWNKLSSSFEALPISFEMQMAGNTTLQDQILEEPVYMLRATSNFILQNTTTTLHPFECYVMPYATPSGTPARMNVRFRGDVPTAIENTDTPSNIGVHKLLRNGQLLILRDGKTYDVIGQKVE